MLRMPPSGVADGMPILAHITERASLRGRQSVLQSPRIVAIIRLRRADITRIRPATSTRV